MDCCYINLDSQKERREQIETDFAAKIGPPWTLQRFSARTPKDVASRAIDGGISSTEKACFLSHLDLISQDADRGETVFVVEDDTAFGSKTKICIDVWLQKLSRTPWDILYSDVTIADVPTMAQLFRIKRELAKSNSLTLIDLSLIPFAGAMGYIVNGSSRRKVAAALSEFQRLDQPFDLCLRELVHRKKLTAIALFPFVTSSSRHSRNSQIQITGAAITELLLDTYRRLVWQESSAEDYVDALAELHTALCDQELDAFGKLVAAMTSEKLLVK
jgi:GR25 family glycosyltransferase involved in LPS biosynthesis